MRTYVGLNLRQNPKKTSLKQFCFNYNLSEDDIKFETLLRICDVTSSKSRVQ
jgi:hypothetical protein